MGTARDVGVLMLRLAFGATCLSHGAQQLFGRFDDRGVEGEGGEGIYTDFEPGKRNPRLAGVLETGGGALLALGLATGPVAAALAGNMMVASSVNARNGLINTDQGYELPVTYVLVATTFALTGPGRFSIDHLIGGVLNKPWMRVLALMGALASAAYLIVTRSAAGPDREDSED